MMMISDRQFLAWPLRDESFLKSGFRIIFDVNKKFVSSTPIADMSDGESYMRPTLVHMRDLKKIYFLGGHKDRFSQVYNYNSDKWSFMSTLPLTHNICTFVACRFKNVIFTFMCDSKQTLKSAVHDCDTEKLKLAAAD